jgi:hypothetical protein
VWLCDVSMVSRVLHATSRLLSTRLYRPCDTRAFSAGMRHCEAARPRLTNMLASEVLPPVQVASVAAEGIRLADGLLLPAACIFLEGKVFLWDFSLENLQSWDTAHFAIFEAVTPRPGKTIFAVVWHPANADIELFRIALTRYGEERCASPSRPA